MALSVLDSNIKANILNTVTDYKLQILFVASDTVHLTPANKLLASWLNYNYVYWIWNYKNTANNVLSGTLDYRLHDQFHPGQYNLRTIIVLYGTDYFNLVWFFEYAEKIISMLFGYLW